MFGYIKKSSYDNLKCEYNQLLEKCKRLEKRIEEYNKKSSVCSQCTHAIESYGCRYETIYLCDLKVECKDFQRKAVDDNH